MASIDETVAFQAISKPASRRQFLKRSGAAGMAVAGLAAFAGQAGAAPQAGRSPLLKSLQGEPVQGGTSVWLGHQEIASLSPDDAGPSVHWVIVANIHDSVVLMDHNYEFHPLLAESYESSEDGLTWTFKLRTGVVFHNGDAFSSADVKYTYEYFMNPENATINGVNFTSISSVEAPDESTVVVTLGAPNPAFVAKVATMMILPSAYHAEIGEEAYKAAPVGTGAFKIKEWRPSEYTEIEAFEEHFRGRPYLDMVRLNVVPEASVRATAVETGDADVSVWPLVTEDNLRLIEDDKFKYYKTSSLAVNHFPLNNTHPALSDKAVRQAMLKAIDRQKVIDDIFRGTATLATSNLSPALATWFTADTPQYPYDPAAAMAQLDEAGWVAGGDGVREKDGTKLSFTCTVISGDQARRPEAEVVQQYLAEVGVEMKIEEAPVAAILEALRAGEMDASLFNWTYGGDDADPDASQTLTTDGGNNFHQFSNARVDELMAAGLLEVNLEARQAIYYEIQQIVMEEVPFIPMMFWDLYMIVNKRVQGMPETALAGDPVFLTANEWWIAE